MKIIVAYRRSKLAEKMLEKAIDDAKTYNGVVVLVTSLQQVTPQQDMKAVKDARDALQFGQKFLESKGVSCEVKLIFPGVSPGADVVQFALEENADEIIVGIENKSKVGKFLLGSTAQDIILGAHCAVVTVKV